MQQALQFLHKDIVIGMVPRTKVLTIPTTATFHIAHLMLVSGIQACLVLCTQANFGSVSLALITVDGTVKVAFTSSHRINPARFI